ncbi:MAG: M56 family metallopeptidase [Myxococcota bacterium]
MSALLGFALLRVLVQGFVLGALVWLSQPLWRRCDAATRFALLFAVLMSVPGLMLWAVLDLLGRSGGVSTSSTPSTWMPLLAHGWMLGVVLASARTALELHGMHRLRATGLPLRELHPRLRALGQRLGVTRPVTLVESPAVSSPIVLGWLRPMILVPMGLAASMPPAWLDAVLAHELAHLRRRDPALRIVQRAVEIAFFFHPVLWWLSALLDEAREEACDDLVVDTLRDPLAYARALTELEAMRAEAVPALTAGATSGNLMKRVQRIVHRSNTPAFSHRWWLPLAVVASLAGSSYAAARVTADEDVAELDIAWMPASVSAHEADIVQAAAAHDVDPDLVAIVVLLESRGRATAKSPRGARGLMQLMPATAAEIAAQRGLEVPRAQDLDDPALNLDLGTWYLAQQLERFKSAGDEADVVAWAAAAYNGGPSAAARALRGEAELSDETARYQGLVAALWAERDADASSVLTR